MSRKIPWVRILEVAGAGRDAREGGSQTVRLSVRISSGAPRGLVLAIKEALVAREPSGIVDVRPAGTPAPDAVAPDALIVVCGDQAAVEAALARDAALRGVPVALVAESAVEVPDVGLPEAAAPLLEVLACADAHALVPRLGSWLVGATDRGLTLAANFPFCRPAEVDALVRRCALENAAVGAVTLIPGSDMAVMTANQAKLAIDIAVAYGRGLDPSRALELAGVVVAGFGYRAIARAAVRLAPGLGWALKGAMGYAGTVATARALRARFGFEDGSLRPHGEEAPRQAPARRLRLPGRAGEGEAPHVPRVRVPRATSPSYVVLCPDGSVRGGE
ncbi:MAG: hypothetical protein SPD98_00185 [Tractidigestivibacter sp.]|uniref:hypothetical protein n=1 Tax=Tractidigestivibacter sp. TaxID=2847320 RepID=UPI002A806EDD|nr:hypothetical protein [Tractidigestivibacter sp.]MDD7584065.1 hypothetical protein [Coriobacteriaceae bacterium]MDY4533652.1 hypothetical protein [Tractidigestivibacter sp.]